MPESGLLGRIQSWRRARRWARPRLEGRVSVVQDHLGPETYTAPAGRRGAEAYPEVLVGLRLVDPRAEILYGGEGVWMVGAVWTRHSVREAAAIEIQKETAAHSSTFDPVKYQWCRAVREGFRTVANYTEEEMGTGWPVRDFAERDRRWRTERESESAVEFARRVGGAYEEEEYLELLQDKLESEYRDIHARAWQHRRTFTQRVAAPWMGRPRAYSSP